MLPRLGSRATGIMLVLTTFEMKGLGSNSGRVAKVNV